MSVRIISAASCHPALRVTQREAVEAIAALGGDGRRAAAIARGSRIDGRSLVVAPCELPGLGSIAERNGRYRELAPPMARRAALRALGESDPRLIRCLVSSSCTGSMLPGWGVSIVEELGLANDTVRLPITEAGCAGGALAIARAADYVRARPGAQALAVAAELCSLSFHAGGDEGNLVASMIFGDGAGSALLAEGASGGIEVVDSASVLVPGSQHALRFDLTDAGYYPVLTRDLPGLLAPAAADAVGMLLERNGLRRTDVGAWLLHPGGAAILDALQRSLDVGMEAVRWSWEAMREYGNTSSAAVFDVLRRYIASAPADGEWSVLAAFGPGVSIELVLLRNRCA